MKLVWAEQAREDYLYWQKKDKKTLQRINRFIKEAKHEPYKFLYPRTRVKQSPLFGGN